MQKTSRLAGGESFRGIFRRADIHITMPLLTLLARRKAGPPSRLNIIASRRHCPLAVRRNYFKRAVRSCFQKHNKNLPPLNILVFAETGVKECTRAGLFRQVAHTWETLREKLG